MTCSVSPVSTIEPRIHDRHLVADMLDDAEVVGDEDRGDAEVLLQVDEQVEDLRLHAHVERADRFVGDDQLGFAGERRGDPDPLALAARKMGRQPARQRGVEADPREQVEHAPVAVGGVPMR